MEEFCSHDKLTWISRGEGGRSVRWTCDRCGAMIPEVPLNVDYVSLDFEYDQAARGYSLEKTCPKCSGIFTSWRFKEVNGVRYELCPHCGEPFNPDTIAKRFKERPPGR